MEGFLEATVGCLREEGGNIIGKYLNGGGPLGHLLFNIRFEASGGTYEPSKKPMASDNVLSCEPKFLHCLVRGEFAGGAGDIWGDHVTLAGIGFVTIRRAKDTEALEVVTEDSQIPRCIAIIGVPYMEQFWKFCFQLADERKNPEAKQDHAKGAALSHTRFAEEFVELARLGCLSRSVISGSSSLILGYGCLDMSGLGVS